MVDPFESLRHDAERTGSTEIDPRFRADLLAEARRRLSSEASADSIRSRVTADTPTPTQMEPIPMLAKQPKKTRPILLAAACVALIAAGAVAVIALQDDESDEPPAVIDTVPTPSTEEATPLTEPAIPESTAPVPETTAAAQDDATTIVEDQDDALARHLLLTHSEYYPDLFPALTPLGINWDPVQAAALPACASYTDSVFQPIAEHDDYTVFHREAPLALAIQYASVLESEEQATSVMNAMAEPAFLQCGIDYRAADAGTYCCDGEKTLPEPLGFAQPSTPPFETLGDQLNFYDWETPWLDENGVEHGQDDRLIGAFVRVGRAIVYVEGLVESSDTEPIVTPESFRQILENVVARADAVLSGIEYVPPTTTTLPPPPDIAAAQSMLLPTNDYAPGWIAVSQAVPVDLDPQVASGISECETFMASVFDPVAAAPHNVRVWRHVAPLSSLFGQYVVVLPDVEVARTLFATLNDSEFGPCATTYDASRSGTEAFLPSFFDQPSVESPGGPVGDELMYRQYPYTWTDGTGQVHAETVLDAAIRVDRALIFIRTLNVIDGAEVVSADEFHDMLIRVVERAHTALA